MRRVSERHTRLLPWSTPEGKPCLLLTDHEGSYLSRLAGTVEAAQLNRGAEILGLARARLDDPRTEADELRFLSATLADALGAALRVAKSRGARLASPTCDEDPLGGEKATEGEP